ncbi:hypothetical protein HK102_010392, partial [Quaeritorhiza haematococci]
MDDLNGLIWQSVGVNKQQQNSNNSPSAFKPLNQIQPQQSPPRNNQQQNLNLSGSSFGQPQQGLGVGNGGNGVPRTSMATGVSPFVGNGSASQGFNASSTAPRANNQAFAGLTGMGGPNSMNGMNNGFGGVSGVRPSTGTGATGVFQSSNAYRPTTTNTATNKPSAGGGGADVFGNLVNFGSAASSKKDNF